MLGILIAVLASAISYILFIRPYKYWTARGIKQGQPKFPFGDNWDVILRKQSAPEMVQMIYNYDQNSRYCGMYQFLTPTLVIRDPELIKQITVKDFDYFMNHSPLMADNDVVWTKNLLGLNNQQWRDMRATLSPAFTNSKMKILFSLTSETGEKFAKYFLKQDKDLITLEMKDCLTRFTNDIIVNSVFGVKCDSLEDKNNEFYLNTLDATNFTGFWRSVKRGAYLLAPLLYKIFKFTLFSKNVQDFFRRIIKENITLREKQGLVRPDMIHLLVQARKKAETGGVLGTNVQISDDDILAHVLIFFFAGFDSVSSLMCYMSHELAVNSDIQQKLRNEVDEVVKNGNGKLTYEDLTGMKYFDMVVQETLRKWPSFPLVDRKCTKPYTIEPQRPGEKPLHLAKDSLVWLPIFALHRDPNLFPNPEQFDPERFSDENKHNIHPYAFIPFGAGPRNCIGARFAVMEAKVLFFYILSTFEIVPVQKTENPLTLNKKGFTTSAKNGFWLGLKRRVK